MVGPAAVIAHCHAKRADHGLGIILHKVQSLSRSALTPLASFGTHGEARGLVKGWSSPPFQLRFPEASYAIFHVLRPCAATATAVLGETKVCFLLNSNLSSLPSRSWFGWCFDGVPVDLTLWRGAADYILQTDEPNRVGSFRRIKSPSGVKVYSAVKWQLTDAVQRGSVPNNGFKYQYNQKLNLSPPKSVFGC
jgi:hypothetical protein